MKYEYFLLHDDNAAKTGVLQNRFQELAAQGWRFKGTIGFNANQIVFEREAKVFDQNDE